MRQLWGHWRLPLAGTAATVIAGIGWWIGAADGGAPICTSTQRVAVVDGPRDDQPVVLDTTFFRPAGRGRAPAVLLAHGFGESKDDMRSEATDLARHGYAVLTWSARGFGRSGGQIALDSPDYEVKDVRRLVDWLARRPEVRLDRAGDPRVGIAGRSYGGALALMAAAYDSRVDAIVPQITWYDLADALFPDASGRGPGAGVFKKLWAGIFFTGGSMSSAPGGSAGPGNSARTAPDATACGRFLPSLCAMYEKVAETGRPTAAAIRTLRRSSPSSVTGRIRVPALLIQGQADSLFPLDQADANARAIIDAPVKVVWYQGGHDGGEPETVRLRTLERDWFDRYLRQDPSAGTAGSAGFTVTRAGAIDSSTQRPTIRAATAARYPGMVGEGRRAVPLTGPPQTIRNPAGGSPAAISALPGFGALTDLGESFGGGLDVDTPGQEAVFDSASLAAPVRLSGTARVRIHVSGAATLFAKIYDAGPAGPAAPARRLAAPLRLTGPGDADVRLPGMDYLFDRGHRIRVVLATTDMAFASPPAPASYQVAVVSALTVPVDPGLRTPVAPLPWWTWGLPLIALGAAVVLLATGRRVPGGPGGPNGAQSEAGDASPDGAPPLQIGGLTKRYRNGQLAVDGLSFRVERGQVCGLLGPNGAGKTTTLRMLMGLVRPDAGEIRIFGHPVTPGAPVLSRLGSFVEGPGFLPHLSGRDNLKLYWRCTGRPVGDAHLDEALEIAALGEALRRPVRTYSQGMRQRLAITQAILGLPDLLVLDEPTNGLDPPQIAAMRDVLVRYAAGGRTVIVSSHMLAEVEQTCTHVVVMHQGVRIAAGPVAEIAGHEGAIVVGTPHAGHALRVLGGLDGVESSEPYAPGVLVRLGGSTPGQVVSALVHEGVEVDRVLPHRRLEDAFLSLIGRGGDHE